MTPEMARNLLVKRGCDPNYLDFLVQFVNLARSGNAPFFPTRADDVFANADARRLDALEKRIRSLTIDLSGLWTEQGASFIRIGIKQPWMLELPNLLNRYWLDLKTMRRALQTRRPKISDLLKSFLVKYVHDATGGRHGWHDGALAFLCGEEPRTWSKWRENHFWLPPPTTSEKASQPIEFLPVSPDTES